MTLKKLLSCLTIACIGIIVLLVLYACPSSYFLGIPCPGCGMTRAFLSLLHLDFKTAFFYHPLFPVVIIAIIFYFLNYLHIITLSKAFQKNACYVIALMFFIVYFFRLFTGSSITQIHLEEGFFAKLLHSLKR